MKPTLLLAIFVVATLGGCHRKKAHSSPPSPAQTEPTLSVVVTKIDSIRAHQFQIDGHACKSIEVNLLQIDAQGSRPITHYTYSGLPETFRGTIWLLAHDGEPFGKKGQLHFTLGESLPAAAKTSSSSEGILLEGPFPSIVETSSPQGAYDPAREHVLYAQCLMKRDHGFSTGDVESLKKLAAEIEGTILAVTIRWES